jgi:DNA-binding transcriptional ArsR family regulator
MTIQERISGFLAGNRHTRQRATTASTDVATFDCAPEDAAQPENGGKSNAPVSSARSAVASPGCVTKIPNSQINGMNFPVECDNYIEYSRFMDMTQSLFAFSALSQQTRLEVLRLLIGAGEAGMQAGEIGEALGVRQNTMSTNLAILVRAGLIRNEREGRAIRYFADLDGVRGLLSFLMEDCCGGKPELCAPVLDQISCKC